MGLLHEGQTVGSSYEVERFLGEGAFAEVYRVKHRFLGRQAMKVFKMVGMSLQEVEVTLGEAVLLSHLHHPNIISVFDANTTETSRGTCGYFTMEYIAGGSLEQFWKSHGSQFVPVTSSVDVLRQVCRGLAVAHSEVPPIIHRDIKPQNILVGYGPQGLLVRVSDFGLAKRVNPMTLLASARGTRCFKPPEVFRDPQSDSMAGDVWAVGTTLYLLLTDRLPYGEWGEDIFDSRCFDRPIIPPSRLNLQVDALLDQIAMRALALKPEERYPTVKQMLDDLEGWHAKPGDAKSKVSPSSEMGKSALGVPSPANERLADEMVAKARALAKQPGHLTEAADLLEEALNKYPGLREKWAYWLKLWRLGKIG